VKRAIDSDNITLRKHFFEIMNSAATDFLLDLRREGLVIKVEEFLAVEGYETSQDTFADSANSDSSDDFAFDVERVFGDGSDVPFSSGNLFVSRDKVADKSKHGKDDCLQIQVRLMGLDWGRSGDGPCSATETTLEPVTSATRIFFSLAALRSMWSEPVHLD
jgi:hypothetical protein